MYSRESGIWPIGFGLNLPFQQWKTAILTPHRKFLFLQGPHGPFFRQLGAKIVLTGSDFYRIGFNRGDAVFWGGNPGFTAFSGHPEDWPEFLEAYLDTKGITDIVLYGDSRPIHATARLIAQQRGITAHCFEEGYLRPYWATYERGGTNGHSTLMDLDMGEIRRAVEVNPTDVPEVPAQWGSAWHHVFYGFLYHLILSIPGRKFRKYRPHRQISVAAELGFYLRKLILMPVHGILRRIRTRHLLRSGAIYHLALLQLSHDESLRNHSDFNSVEEFIRRVITEFAKGGPSHHLLVFKAHPFEDGREPLPAIVREIAAQEGISERVLYVPGGKLGPLLDRFLRSTGLSASLTPAASLVLDECGIYYDPTRPSQLERSIAASDGLPAFALRRAAELRRRILAAGVSKYNVKAVALPDIPEGRRILVVGQVENDASIRLGAGEACTNLGLLRAAQMANPDAYIIFKPHPDVEAGLRDGKLGAQDYSDAVMTNADPVKLIEGCDEVWTMTSLLGFEALMRGKDVTCSGAPFYAGWGLTRDMGPKCSRRGCAVTLDQLVHAALVDYPRYVDRVSGLPCTAELIVGRLAEGQANTPPKLRALAKVQGIIANRASIWR